MLPARNYVLPLSNGRPRISFFDISFFSQLLFLLSPPSSTPTHTHFSSTQWWETASENPSSVLMLLLPIFLVSAFFFLFFFTFFVLYELIAMFLDWVVDVFFGSFCICLDDGAVLINKKLGNLNVLGRFYG